MRFIQSTPINIILMFLSIQLLIWTLRENSFLYPYDTSFHFHNMNFFDNVLLYIMMTFWIENSRCSYIFISIDHWGIPNVIVFWSSDDSNAGFEENTFLLLYVFVYCTAVQEPCYKNVQHNPLLSFSTFLESNNWYSETKRFWYEY